MEWVEATAKSVQEAKDEALDRLGIGPDDAEFEVLEEPRTGLFGLRRGSARIRARVRPAAVRPKQDRRQRRRDGAGGGGGGGRGRGESRTGESRGDRQEHAGDQAATVTSTTGDERSTPGADGADKRDDRPARRRGGRGRGNSGSTRGAAAAAEGNYRAGSKGVDVDTENNTNGAERPGGDVAVADVQAAAERFAVGLLDAFGIDGSASSSAEGTEIDLSIDPTDGSNDGVGLLIGPGGRTLLAIQELARVAAQRRLGDHETRLRVDVAGYRERRREALEKFAHHVAELVKESGVGRSLDPMPSPDRKVIHDVLSGIDGVTSRSEGEDPQRRIVVSPDGSAVAAAAPDSEPQADDDDTADDAADS